MPHSQDAHWAQAGLLLALGVRDKHAANLEGIGYVPALRQVIQHFQERCDCVAWGASCRRQAAEC